jgi:hypothetical protein
MTITQTPSYVFPSLVNDIHIMGHLNKIILTFDHLSTQLPLVGLKVKMLKCKLWNPSRIFSSIKNPLNYILVTNDLHILGVPMGFQNFVTHFLNEVLLQNMRILMIFFSWETGRLH